MARLTLSQVVFVAVTAGLWPTVVAAAAAPAPPAPTASAADKAQQDIAGWEDVARRMSVPVMVDGKGPYRFIVDTGADHSVLSEELAAELSLPPGPQHLIHGVSGDQLTGGARVAKLSVGARKLEKVDLPTLSRANLGGDGIVGVDILAGQKVVLDFEKTSMRVEASHGYAYDPDAIVVHAKKRFGHLVLVDSSVRRKPIYVILDSGAQDTIANTALINLLAERRGANRAPEHVGILSVTGQTAEGVRDELPELTLGGMGMRHVPVVRADLHTFKQFDLANEPAMLLGVDVMRAFRQVQVDFARREVVFGLIHAPNTIAVTVHSQTGGGGTRIR